MATYLSGKSFIAGPNLARLAVHASVRSKVNAVIGLVNLVWRDSDLGSTLIVNKLLQVIEGRVRGEAVSAVETGFVSLLISCDAAKERYVHLESCTVGENTAGNGQALVLSVQVPLDGSSLSSGRRSGRGCLGWRCRGDASGIGNDQIRYVPGLSTRSTVGRTCIVDSSVST